MEQCNKEAARGIVEGCLEGITSSEFAAAASEAQAKAVRLLSELGGDAAPHTVLLYYASPERREVNLSSLEEAFPTVQFDYVPYSKTAPFPAALYDVIFVPLYGFSANNYRLGRGGGWYDRFLAKQPQALKVGVGLKCCGIDFAVQPHDVPMDCIIVG